MQLIIEEKPYFSYLDEKFFFEWLQSIEGVENVSGTPEGLFVTLSSAPLSEGSIRDLLAIHARYGLAMRHLAKLETPANSGWFRSPDKYWYKQVFG